MKFNKIFALILAATMFTACSEDDEINNWNSNDVTVSLANDTISVKENLGVFNVPVVVEGEMNGIVEVTVKVAEVIGDDVTPAMEDVHYVVTEKTIKIVAEEGKGDIEIKSVDDTEINESRVFTVEIVDVKAGKVGENTTTTVILKDNDSVFYEKLQARWKMNIVSKYDGATSWNVNIVGYQEGEEGYNQVLYINGILGIDGVALGMNYYFDMDTKKGYLEIPLGQVVAAYNESYDVFACTVTPDGYLSLDGTVKGEWNEDMTEIVFGDTEIVFYVMNGTTGAALGVYDWIEGGFTLTR